jgi:hypothetical protein
MAEPSNRVLAGPRGDRPRWRDRSGGAAVTCVMVAIAVGITLTWGASGTTEAVAVRAGLTHEAASSGGSPTEHP